MASKLSLKQMLNIFTYVVLSFLSVSYSAALWSFTGSKVGMGVRGFIALAAYVAALAGPLSPGWLVYMVSVLPVPSFFGPRFVTTVSVGFTLRASRFLRNSPTGLWLLSFLAFRLVVLSLIALCVSAGSGAAVLLALVFAGLVTSGYILFLMYLPVLLFVILTCFLSLPDLVVMLISGRPSDRFARSISPFIALGSRQVVRAAGGLWEWLCLVQAGGAALVKLFLDVVYISTYSYARLFEANWFTGVNRPGAVALRTFLSIEVLHWVLFPAFSFISVVLYFITFLVGFTGLAAPVLHAFGIGFWQDPVFEAKVLIVLASLPVGRLYVFVARVKLEAMRWANLLAPTLQTSTGGLAPYKLAFVSVFMFFIPLYILYDLVHNVSIVAGRMMRFVITIPFRIFTCLFFISVLWILPDMPFVFLEVCVAEVWEGLVKAWGEFPEPGPLMALVRNLPMNFAFGWDENAHLVDAYGGDKKALETKLKEGLPFDRLSTLYTAKTINLTRRVVLKAMARLDNLKLPEFISAQYKAPTVESLRSTYQVLADVGLPTTAGFVDSVDPTGDPTGNPYLMEFADLRTRVLAATNFRLGFKDPKIGQHPWVKALGDLTEFSPPFISSMSFTGPREEIKSTARYYADNTGVDPILDTAYFDDLVDGAWQGVRKQFANSRLTSLQDIFKQWFKHRKYSFGFGVGTKKPSGRVTQMTREQVVMRLGGKSGFIRFMEQIFYMGTNLNFPANVFTKDETLKPSKALERKVRTIVGIAFPHYVRQLVTNFWPDHNYHPWEVPGKVGMAINGANFSRIAGALDRHEKVWAGDMTAFDSSQIDIVVRIVAAIRKKGYDRVKDYDKICELIDVTYEGLLHQPLGFKNIGLVFSKDRGFTTGHGSTSADNTLALLVNYLYAWRHVTGLRSREFYYYNTLINLGDDHVLGYDEVFGWNPERAMEAMKVLGTSMRNEAPGYDKLPKPGMRLPCGDPKKSPLRFLSKVWLPKSGQVLVELEDAGMSHIRYPSCHDQARLVGRMTGVMRMKKVSNPMTSYTALLSYIDLTAHHKELYTIAVTAANQFYSENSAGWVKHGIDLDKVRKPPSYRQVIQRWYTTSMDFDIDVEHEKADNDDEKSIVLLTHDDAFSFFVRWMADFPTLLSPRYLSTRWADWLQSKLSSRLSWPIALVGKANHVGVEPTVVGWYLARTPYSFLRSPALIPATDIPYGVLLFRHWFFMAVSRLWGRGRSLSLFDLVRVFDNFISNFVFMTTGSLSVLVIDLDLHFMETLTVLIASYIEVGPDINPFMFKFPTLSLALARVISKSLRSVFPSGSVDMQPFDALAERLVATPGRTALVSAPTGTSKSTRMMERLSNIAGVPVCVIEPRHLVCKGVGLYMQSLFPNSGIGIATEGYKASSDDRLVYATVQSLMSSTFLRTGERLYVLDEAHIQEPHYHVVRRWLATQRKSVMYLTATPPEGLVVDDTLAVPAVNAFSVTESEQDMPNWSVYISRVKLFLDNLSAGTKVLIFVPTNKLMVEVGRGRSVCYLSSSQKEVDLSKDIFISTSVSDAGLTIPDVSVVWTTDADITLSQPDREPTDAEIEASITANFMHHTPPDIYYYRLSEQTIKQRRGRTGRTSDGIFFLVHMPTLPVKALKYTRTDYMSALSPAAETSVPYFPKEILEIMSESDKAAGYIWDTVPSASWTSYMNLFRMYRNQFQPGTTFKAWLVSNKAMLLRKSKPYDSDEVPVMGGGPTLPPTLPVNVGIEPVVTSDDSVPVEAGTTRRRRNIPSEGWLCGVHVIRAAIQNRTDLCPSVNLLHLQCMEVALSSDTLADEDDTSDFYGFDVIVAVLTRLYHVKVQLVAEGVTLPLFSYNQDLPGEPFMIYLDNLHYNYFGLAYDASDTNDDDDMVYAWLDRNDPLESD